ncbi:nucleotidyltransferase domain-containing protein [Streptomyces sp. NPDC008238]
MEDPLGAARALLADRFPDALAGFLGGSTARGEGTATSDLDVVVVLGPPAGCHAESFVWGSWPVELFVHTPESARAFMGWDRDRGSGTMAFMCARGAVLFDRDGTAARLRDAAERILAAGPPAVPDAARDHRRYSVTDLRDDLIGARDEDELLAVAAALLDGAAELLLVTRGHWRGGGKWLPRRLREADPELAGVLLGGYRDLVRGGPPEEFAAVVDVVLDACGGPLWAGYRRTPDPRVLAELGLRPA